MKVLIIEDERIAANKLEKLLKQVSPEIQILDKLETVRDSVTWLSKHKTDLIFLDIHLADGNGFNIFDQIKINTPIIFITAYDQYAIKAFKLNSIDYLLKPIDIDELRQSLKKFEKQTKGIDYDSLAQLLQNSKSAFQKRFLINVG